MRVVREVTIATSTMILAGFECGREGGHDFLASTGHVPSGRMRQHYGIVKNHGIAMVRDGLPPGHDVRARMQVARDAGLQVIWDIQHQWVVDDPVAYAKHVARTALEVDIAAPLWVCVNESMIMPLFTALSWHDAAMAGLRMIRVLKDNHPDVRVLITDPINGFGEHEYAAADALTSSGLVDWVGVNTYPHTIKNGECLPDILTATWKRYHLPVLVAETSWHNGHPDHHRLFPGWDKASWLRFVLFAIKGAVDLEGANVVGCCWYPIVSCPAWDTSPVVWDHGLIRPDFSVDPALSAALMERAPQAQAA